MRKGVLTLPTTLLVYVASVAFAPATAAEPAGDQARAADPAPTATTTEKTGLSTESPLSDDESPAVRRTAFGGLLGEQDCIPWLPGHPCGECGPDGTGYRLSWTPDRWVQIAAQIRTSFNSVTEGAPGPNGNFFRLDNFRILFSGKVNKYVGFELNTDVPDSPTVPVTDVQLLDAIFKLEYNDAAHLWIGRFRPPSDRVTLDGPFFINTWDLPFVSHYFSIFEGRDNGAVYWGQYAGGKLKWSAGLFNGLGRQAATGEVGAPNQNGNPEFAARVTYNFLDPEPGYSNYSTYYGTKDILAIGFAVQTQSDAYGSAANPQNATEWNIDALWDTKLTEWGAFTVEGAFYDYTSSDPNALAATDPNATRPGTAWFAFAGWLLPQEIGSCGICGRFRPFVRYQNYDYDNGVAAAQQRAFTRGWDVGLEYVMKGHDARITAFWGDRDVAGDGRIDIFRVGAQACF